MDAAHDAAEWAQDDHAPTLDEAKAQFEAA
jgi:hypothetical protein